MLNQDSVVRYVNAGLSAHEETQVLYTLRRPAVAAAPAGSGGSTLLPPAEFDWLASNNVAQNNIRMLQHWPTGRRRGPANHTHDGMCTP